MAKERVALVLSGGGARGAYQAGVLKALSQIARDLNNPRPVQTLSGVSAGSINVIFWAATAHDLGLAAAVLEDLWSNLTTKEVFRTDVRSLSGIGMNWLVALAMGNWQKKLKAQALLDTTPLRGFLKSHIPFENIEKNFAQDFIRSVAITATDYSTSQSITFVQGQEPVKIWTRSSRRSEKAILNVDHIMASAAIPIFFPPVQLGPRYFGDGCLRNMAPLSPAIHLGADRLIIVGVRKPPTEEEMIKRHSKPPGLARILSVIINSIFFDATEADVERLSRINRMVETIDRIPSFENPDIALRPIHYLWIQPSQDLGQIARNFFHKLPKMLQHLVSGLGSVDEAADLVSYLLFEPSYCKTLVDLGYNDCMAQRAGVEKFFSSAAGAEGA